MIKTRFTWPLPILNKELQTCNCKTENSHWTSIENQVPLTNAEILSPHKKTTRYAGFKNSMLYK